MQLELSERELEELVGLVKTAHNDLATEIHHARVTPFREDLRQRRAVLEGLLQRLETKLPQPA